MRVAAYQGMKPIIKRIQPVISKLRARLVSAIKAQDDAQASKHLARLNRVCAIQRNRNLANGMPGTPWINQTLDQVKTQVIAKGL